MEQRKSNRKRKDTERKREGNEQADDEKGNKPPRKKRQVVSKKKVGPTKEVTNLEELYTNKDVQKKVNAYYPYGRPKPATGVKFPPLERKINDTKRTKLRDWKPHQDSTKLTVLEWFSSAIESNKERIKMEFMVELRAKDALSKDEDAVVYVDDMEVPAKTFFTKGQVRWGSYTLLGRGLMFIYEKFDLKNKTPEWIDRVVTSHKGNGTWNKKSNLFACLYQYFFPWVLYETFGSEKFQAAPKDETAKVKLVDALNGCLGVADLLLNTMYDELMPTSIEGKSILNLDSNFYQEILNFFEAVGGLDVKMDFKPKVEPIIVFSEFRKAEKEKRASHGIIDPVKIKETDIHKFAGDLVSRVYGDITSKERWDTFKISFGDFDEVMPRVCAAMLLLQLVVGSRFRGIFALNKIERYEGETKTSIDEETKLNEEKRNVIKGINHSNLIVVSRLSKEKDINVDVWLKMKSDGENNEIDEEAATEVATREREFRKIAKGLQYYFLDPVMMATWVEPSKRLALYSDRTNPNPVAIFFHLLSEVRGYVHYMNNKKKFIGDDQWEKYIVKIRGAVGDKRKKSNKPVTEEIYTLKVGTVQSKKKGFMELYNFFYPTCNRMCKKLLGQYFPPRMSAASTHELRRLYVCYSYKMFASNLMKEVAYAQAVLLHASINSSVHYISLQIEMTVGNTLGDIEKMSQTFSKRLNEIEKETRQAWRKTYKIPEMEKMSKNISEMDEKMKKMETRVVEYTKTTEKQLVRLQGLRDAVRQKAVGIRLKDGGGTIEIEKLPRASKNQFSESELIERGLQKAIQVRDAGGIVSQNILKQLGVNNLIVKGVWRKFLERSQSNSGE